MGALARVGAIAGSEARRSVAGYDRRTLALLLLAGVIAGLLLPSAMESGIGFDRGLYRVAVAPDAPLRPAIAAWPAFQMLEAADPRAAVDAGLADVGVTSSRLYASDTAKGQAAVAALARAAKDHAYQRLLQEPDQAAAFPVRVEVRYVPQQGTPEQGPRTAPGGQPSPTAPSSEVPVVGGGSGGEAGPAQPAPRSAAILLPPERSVTTPEALAPPFPFRSLLLAYLFLVPMNFIVQAYGGSVIAERIGRRAEPVLASPARAWEVIAGKALPHLALALGVSVAVALAIGAGWLSVLAVLPLALAFFALEFLAAMFARSFRELTFLTVFISVMLTVYAFLPAVFAQLSPVAMVSPIALVVQDLRGEPVGLAQALYATLPLASFALVLYLLGAALHREEDLFHQKPLRAKLLDALARQVRRPASGFKLAVLLIPCVLVVELLVVVGLVAVSAPLAVGGALVAVALIEESFKGLPSYAAVSRGAIPRHRALAFGALSGLGFFAAEKGFLLVSLVGLLEVPAGAAVFGGPLTGASLAAPAVLLLAAPLALHVGTASLTGWGARGGRGLWGACLVLAVAVHAAYNALVLAGLGGAP